MGSSLTKEARIYMDVKGYVYFMKSFFSCRLLGCDANVTLKRGKTDFDWFLKAKTCDKSIDIRI